MISSNKHLWLILVAWVHYHHSGLDVSKLTDEQRVAYEKLNQVIKTHRHVPVTELNITSKNLAVDVGDSVAMRCEIVPAQAMRQNIIWESGKPAVVTVDKFGIMTAKALGNARIFVYSWEDVSPVAANLTETYSHNGIQDSIKVVVSGHRTRQ